MDGFKLYVTNTSTIPPDGYLCYEDPDPGFPNIIQTIPCNQLGKYVIYYDDKGSTEVSNGNTRVIGPIVELCYVAINGGLIINMVIPAINFVVRKSFWGSNCQHNCAEDCIGRNCFPGNGSCVWGCIPTHCLNDFCDKDTAVCTIGCKERRTEHIVNSVDNIASDGLVSQYPSGGQSAYMANDGYKKTCSKTQGTIVTFQVDLKDKSIVTGLYILLGEGTTKEGYHTVYASNNSNTWNSGKVLYNGTVLPTEISFQEVFSFLTYMPPVGSPLTELEMCEIGIIGCPPTHYGPLCNTTCPPNCNGPCELDVGDCLLGCTNGWTGNRCDGGDNNFFIYHTFIAFR
ncbi:unnamed protein product [Mytilus edulis]|uniref:Uncharacterized protein n=1 Tax=Mytilus edulis TaxID=6550 RepID=A0A8S3T6D5_MYTED|nr:unnamed protein product [Mytilus edulis]